MTDKELLENISLSWCRRHRPESESTDWGQSLLMYGLIRAFRIHRNDKVRQYIRQWLAFHLAEHVPVHYFCGSWSFALLYPDIVEEFPEFKLQLDETSERIYDVIRHKALRNGDGVILHNVDLPNIYIDTVYYSSVLLSKLGTYLDKSWRDESLKQLRSHLSILRDGSKRFFIHCQENLGGKRSEGSWARGNGWVMMTYAELLSYQFDLRIKEELVDGFVDLTEALILTQTQNGLWRTILDDDTSYEETSASAMFLFAIVRAKGLGIFGSQFDAIIRSASEGLAKHVDEEYKFLGASEGTWPGTVEYYKSLSRGEWWWGTGAYLLALSEITESKL